MRAKAIIWALNEKVWQSIFSLTFVRFKVATFNAYCCGFFLIIGATCSYIDSKPLLHLYVILYVYIFLYLPGIFYSLIKARGITENSDVRDQHSRWMRIHLADIYSVIFSPHTRDGQSPIVWILEAHAIPWIRCVSSITKS